MVGEERGWLQRFIIWRERNIKEKRFILLLSFLVGIFTAFAALILKVLIHWIQNFLTENFDTTEANYQYLIYPVVGIFLAGLFVRYVVKDDISHGVTKILYAISRRQGRIKRHNTWSSIIASSITIGFGGSVGAEAPIVLTGSAIGSNLGSLFRMEHRTLMLLVGCGAAGAVAGIFKAPIAGLVFTLEVLMIDLTMSSLLPLLISAVTAATVSYIVTGTEAMFKFHLDQAFELERIPYVIMLGIFCGLVSLYFTRAMNSVEGLFGKLKLPYKKLLVGGSMLSILIFLFPPLYGEGYDTIELLLNGTSNVEWDTVMNNSFFYGHSQLLLLYLILIILFKVFASSATNGGGGCGGIFAPSLYLGCIAGFVFSHFSNDFEMTAFLPEKNFALLGMAGVMSGVMHAPLTGVFLIAELTGGYDLFLPLMIVAVSSYLTIIVFEPHSIYSMRLAKKGELLTHHKDKAVLTLMKMENVVEKDFVAVHPEMDLAELVKAISASHRNIFPVTDKEDKLIGIVLLDDIRNIMFRQELYHRFTVGKLMTSVPARLYDTDSMEQVMRTFDDTKVWNLPVVDTEGKYLGFVSKSKIFNSYRQVLVHFQKINKEMVMRKEDLRIVYMGTPEFAVEPLRCLVEGGYNIAGVITMPDKPAGRGHKVQFSPVKQYALEHGLPLLQPEKLKDETFVEALRALNADLQIVVAFRMLPEVVWNMPRLGTFNLHASLLPQYRGAAPINWAVINGDTETGITTFFLKHEIDTGEVIQQVRVPIADTDNVGIVHDKLMMLGGRLVVETVDAIIAGKVKPVPQEEMAVVGELRPAPKIFKDTCRIDWNMPVKRIYDFIRGLSPYPAAWTELVQPDGTVVVLKIFETGKMEQPHRFSPGTLQTDGKTYIRISGTDGWISVRALQLPGKKRLKTDELLRGFKLTEDYKVR